MILLATKAAPSNNAADIAATRYAVAVSMVLDRLDDNRLALGIALKPLAVVMALLAAVLRPRLSWRLALAIVAIALFPFATAGHEYVLQQYQGFFDALVQKQKEATSTPAEVPAEQSEQAPPPASEPPSGSSSGFRDETATG